MITLEHELAEDLRTIDADDSQIELLLLDFGLNAMDTMPEGGRLRFRTANRAVRKGQPLRYGVLPPGEYVQLSVSDTVHGISLKEPDGLLEVPAGGDTESPPKDLRLSAVSLIVMNHGGFIDLPKDEGQGIEIYFPTSSSPRGPTQP
jgi:hypothetical protein